MASVRRSLLFTFAQSYLTVLLQFIASVLIARLLTPAEIGIFSVAAVMVGFAHTLRDFGAASYIVQEKELTEDRIRAVFAMTLITAWIMAFAIAVGSSYAAEFYKEPGIRQVMLVLALNFFLVPFGTVPMAYLQRQMDFYHISIMKVLSTMVATVTSVVLAYKGFSYLSMAWGAVAGVVVSIVLAQVWRPKGLPFLPGFKEIKRVLSFGSLSSLIMILNDLSQGLPDLILGRLSGMAVVGYFGRAMGLVLIFERFVMSALYSVALPHFAEQARTDGAVRESFLRSVTYASALAWPFFIWLGLFAHPIVTIVYGKQWEPSVVLLQLLCVSLFVSAPFLLLGSMMTAIGKISRNLVLLAIDVPVRALALFIAAPFGLVAIGFAFFTATVVSVVVASIQCRLELEVNGRDMVTALWTSIGVAFASMILPIFTLLFFGGGGNGLWLPFLIGSAGCLLGWLAGLYGFKHPLRVEVGKALSFVKGFVIKVVGWAR